MFLRAWAKKEAFLRSDKGATAIEYGLIVGGIAVTISAVVFTLGTDLTGTFTSIAARLAAVEPAAG
jgi:pilus assembly protein Flp/PilA